MSLDKEKKKLIVVGALLVVMLGLGAFQLVSGGSEPAPKKPKSESKSSSEKSDKSSDEPGASSDESPNETESGAFKTHEPRNPFAEPAAAAEPGPAIAGDSKTFSGTGSKLGNAMGSAMAEMTKGLARGMGEAFKGLDPMRPMQGSLQGNFGDPVAQLPNINPNGEDSEPEAGSTGQKNDPGKILRQPGEFAYKLTGVVIGERPVAILASDDGSQQVAAVGSTVGGARIVSVERGRVVLIHNGKRLTLKLGGDSEH